MGLSKVRVIGPPWRTYGPTKVVPGQPAITLKPGQVVFVHEHYFDPAIMERVEADEQPVDGPEDEGDLPPSTPDEGEEEAVEQPAEGEEPDEEEPEEPKTSEAEEEEAAEADSAVEENSESPYPDGDPEIGWYKRELIAYAEELGLDTSGDKADILERIQEYEQE